MTPMHRVARAVAIAATVCLAACGDGGGGGASDGGADAGDTDTGDTDTGTDTDTDADTDTETNADGGPDGGAAIDGGVDAGADADAGAWNGCVEGSFAPYFGNFHAHTSNSDGVGSPAEAFAMARDDAGLDMQAITDHLEQLYNVLGAPSGEYTECAATAAEYTEDGAFLALCGFEYGSGFGVVGSTGHDVVLFSPDLFPMVQLDFHDFYASAAACPTCLTEFSHPGDEAGQTWSDFEYDAAADEAMNLFDFKGNGDTWSLFFEALDAGWHVSPMHDQDNHSADWGLADDARSGFYMSSLTIAALGEAMRDRRSFMTHDKDAAIRLVADSSCWMGSILTGFSSLAVEATATDAEAGDGFAVIELFGPEQTPISSAACGGAQSCSIDDTVDVTAPTYVVARATQVDGDVLVSAPIWVEP
jgi:hypothetical protein